jgi:uroporphyrinogen-III synthase
VSAAAEADLPLAGVRVVVTRAAHQARATARAFERAGAEVALLPLLELAPPADPAPLAAALASLDGYAWIVFTSANAVERVLDGTRGLPPGLRVASVGEATSDALRARGVEPDLEPAEPRAEGLAAELAPRLAAGARVLLPQAADARPVLARELARAGARVDRVDAYAKRTPPAAHERAAEIFGTASLGWVTFTSPSTAHAFAELGAALWGADWPAQRRGLLAASIGPVTSAALRELGIEPAAEAAAPADPELVAAVVAAVAPRGLGRA